MGQAGYWEVCDSLPFPGAPGALCVFADVPLAQVDGTGIQKIDNPTLAEQLKEKVQRFNTRSAITTGVITVAYVAIPEVVRVFASQ